MALSLNDNAPSVLGLGPAAALLSLTGVEARTIDAQTTIPNGSTGSGIGGGGPNFPATPQSLEILSSNANDTAAGTGARTVRVSGLDGNFDRASVVATMNGAGVVALGGTWMCVDRVEVVTTGAALRNLGNITVRIAGGGATQCQIPANAGRQNASWFGVPLNHSAIIVGAVCTSTPDQIDPGPPANYADIAVQFYLLAINELSVAYETVRLSLPFSSLAPTGLLLPAFPQRWRVRAIAELPITPVTDVRVSLALSVLIVANANLVSQAGPPANP